MLSVYVYIYFESCKGVWGDGVLNLGNDEECDEGISNGRKDGK